MIFRSLAATWVLLSFALGAMTEPSVAQPCDPEEVTLIPLGDVTTWPDAPFRWRDVATNPYGLLYQDTYNYDDASVTVTFQPCGERTFTGHLSAANLKPNFAYQMKLLGKPTALWGEDGDDVTNERVGYAGRWWRVQPNPGNSNDEDYEQHHDDPDYIFEGYLLFDHFTTGRFGNAEIDFALDSSFHVLWWELQRAPQTCDGPVDYTDVEGYAVDPAYDDDIAPVTVGVYAEEERWPPVCYGEAELPLGEYNCRIILTEETFHQTGPADYGWVMVNGNRFWKDAGVFHYAGTNCYYLMVYAADPALRPYVDEVLEDAKEMRLTVVRTWAFNDGAGEWNALQTAPGVYDETVFQGLDYVVDKARQLGLHLILPLVNNWDDYGGMNQYVEWSQGTSPGSEEFVTVNGTHFELDGCPYYYVGTNYWYGLNLASAGSGGDRARLERELDHLRSLGITNLRVMAGSEGPDTEPWRMVPSLQTSPGVYNSEVLDGLDYLLSEMAERDLRAIMCLNNFWPWSGGMAQYVCWNGGGAIPYPPPEPGGDWNEYQDYASDFYSNTGAMQDFQDHISFIVNHVNPYTGLAYKDDPTVMTWELGNEPRGFNNNATDFNIWIDNTAAYIKSLDSNHLVTTGCEGDTPWPSWNGLDFIQNHNGPDIDYTTIHIWPQNWGWYDPGDPGGTYPTAESNARAYFNQHEQYAVNLGKPMVLEEFGLARDGESYDPASSTQWRDTFYADMFDEVYTSASGDGPAAGTNFWAWAGEGRPLEPYGSYWSPGDPWIGDPPHEHQGWYSVYDADATTLAVLAGHAAEMHALTGPTEHDDFYTDTNCRQFYRDHVTTVLNRVNTISGKRYRDDPTILGWELANEPRCESDPSGDVLQEWIETMATYIKTIDSDHLVSTGSEGFYGPSGPAHNPIGWFGTRGVDFIRNHQPAAIDFACFHAWPDHWGMNYNQSMQWVRDHIDDSDALLDKPVILEEFGKQRPLETRDLYYQGWYDEIYAGAAEGKAAGGSNFWILYHDDYPDYDGFGVYYPGDVSTVEIISTEAAKMRALCDPYAAEGYWASAVGCDTLHFDLQWGLTIVRGDTDSSGEINISDPIYSLAYQFAGGDPPSCMDVADCDDSGEINISDPIYNLAYQFAGGPEPPPPFPYPDCGPDPTADSLDCGSFPPCGRDWPGSSAISESEYGETIGLRQVASSAAGTICLLATVETERDLLGLEFGVSFDPQILEYVTLDARGLAGAEMDFLSGHSEPGSSHLRIGGIPDLSLQESLQPGRHELVRLCFNVVGGEQPEVIRITGLSGRFVGRDLVPTAGRLDDVSVSHVSSTVLNLRPIGVDQFWAPNPLGPNSIISLNLAAEANVRIEIYNVTGQRVSTLWVGRLSAGHHEVSWDGWTEMGTEAASSIYYLRATVGSKELIRKALFVR